MAERFSARLRQQLSWSTRGRSRGKLRALQARRLGLEALEKRELLSASVDLSANQLMIQFKPNVSEAAKAAAISSVGGTLKQKILTAPMQAAGKGELAVVTLPKSMSVTNAVARLRANTAVAFSEADCVVKPLAVSADLYYTNGTLWGMYGATAQPPNNQLTVNQYGSHASEVWAGQAGPGWSGPATGSRSIVVGIIDEGIDYNHPDLAPNIWTNPGESGLDAFGQDKQTNGVDDDGNGFVDDVHGWDFYYDDNTVFDGVIPGDGIDEHGTHVAGTIGAVANNQGVVGVNWNVQMISVKFLGPFGGLTSDAVAAVDYLTMLKTRYNVNIVASNNSWGGGGYSQALFDAIARAAKAGIVFVAAAGNSAMNNDVTPFYPACYDVSSVAGYDNVISVAATDSSGRLAFFSHYGATTVDLGAPGVNIMSTLPFNRYAAWDGTSMAAPHVTGAIALYASVHPNASAGSLRQSVLGSAMPTASLRNRTATGGRLDISQMRDFPPSVTLGPDVSVLEGNRGYTKMGFTVTLSYPAPSQVTIAYHTVDSTARAGQDYISARTALIIPAGQTRGTIDISVIGDTVREQDERFFLHLDSATGATLSARRSATGTIRNDDAAPARSASGVATAGMRLDSNSVDMLLASTLASDRRKQTSATQSSSPNALLADLYYRDR